MIYFIIIYLLNINSLEASSISGTSFPVFLKIGFSSVLDFDEAPSRVVLGDPNSFKVERLDKSLVIKPLSSLAESNMFVYFNKNEPMLFILKASEEAEPTFYKKFDSIKRNIPQKKSSLNKTNAPFTRSTRLLSSHFDDKKDYLILEIQITADSAEGIKPLWDGVWLGYQEQKIKPYKLWAERKEVQKDSRVKARFIFAKPNVPRNLNQVTLFIPLNGYKEPVALQMPVRPR